jgi:hypothetical protein
VWDYLWRVTPCRSNFGTEEEFRVFLVQMRARALAIFPEFQPLYPDVPIAEDE